ncbi:MAG: molecular chaperone HtpG [Saprospirales bacterium]|nr:molecular chaperone HtpG [Saprospirales bacterium]MBK8489611.1 molecular chaperone HtpG [Saprospirales bacterium]
MEKGQISVQTENIFPIIKKFLYSDHEIFLRELISNAIDATNKLKTLSTKGDFKGELGDLTIQVLLDPGNKTLTIRDRGIGMTEEEVKKYLNQVAFSSASEFLEKYKEDTSIIGHFGLGFYSAFMVADRVEAISRSYQEKATPVTWSCEGNPEYSLETNEKEDRGTDIVLHINAENEEFLQEGRIEGLLEKYCKFLPIPIQFGTRKETVFEGEGDAQTSKEVEVPNVVNITNPAWKKNPSELKDEDYLQFYQELYPYSTPPLFWIHLNIDYPFNLTGVLYFPRLTQGLELQRNKIQLYSNQVYVTDNVREIVPEFLTMLHGIIDSPDIPLNVSRSYLQNDSSVRRITGFITKKVAEKLNDQFKNSRKDFEEKWNDLGVFVKYGMLSDEKFNEKANSFVLLKSVDKKYFTIDEYKEHVKNTQTDKNGKIVFLYTSSPNDHDSQIKAAQSKGYDVLEFDQIVDNHFMHHLEQQMSEVNFARVDSDTIDQLIQKEEAPESVLSEKEQNTVKELFESLVKGKMGAKVVLKSLAPEDQPVVITRPEFMRRMKEMQALQGMPGNDFLESYNVVINTNHPLIAQKMLKMRKEETRNDLATYLYQLALLHQNMLKGAELTSFIQRSQEMVK